MEKKKKKKKVSAQQNQIEMEEARAMNAVLNVIKDRGFLLEFPRMRPAARRLKPTAHWRTGRDKTGQDRPVWQCAGLQDGLSLVFRTVLSMLNV